MAKLIVVIMGQNCEKFIPMCLESVKDADALIYVDGGSTDNTKEIVQDFLIKHKNIAPASVLTNTWNPEDKQMNGKQRNFYLNILKTGKQWKDYWCLVLDADEVVEDLSKIKQFIQTAKPGLYSPKMRHFIGDLGHEDATNKIHYVPNRLFKISEAKIYPLESHPVLIGKVIGTTEVTTIWHLGHLPVEYMKYIIKRYTQHNNDSIIHTKQFLKNWRDAHLYGLYPTARINPTEIPNVILNNFSIDFDELYFRDRGLEVKHFQMAKQWADYFNLYDGNDIKVIEFGCGKAPYGYAFEYLGISYMGIELSDYAVKNSLVKIEQGDIVNYNKKHFPLELVLAFDVLEHLKYEDLDAAINNLIRSAAENILISVPFKGTPNCDADPTHIIKENRGWWINKFIKAGCKIIKTPDYFQYKEQILIFKK